MSTVSFNLPVSFVTVAQAADIVGCTTSRIYQLLAAKQLDAVQIHKRAWIIQREHAERLANHPHKVGRPRGSKTIHNG